MPRWRVCPSLCPRCRSECRDRDDAVFLQLALAAAVDLLVSGDADLAILRDSVPVRVMSVAELLALLGPDQPRSGRPSE